MLYRIIITFICGGIFILVGPKMSQSHVYYWFAGSIVTGLGWFLILVGLLWLGSWIALRSFQRPPKDERNLD